MKNWCYKRVDWLRKAECVEIVWTHGGMGGLVDEENNGVRCEWCEVERKGTNGMDGLCENSIE